MESGKICIKFFVEPSENEMYDYLKTIPKKHRAWEVKKIFLNKLNNSKDATIAIAPSVSEKENEQKLNSATSKNSATSRKIPTDF